MRNFNYIFGSFIIMKFTGCAPVEQSMVQWTVETNGSNSSDLFLPEIKKYGQSIGLEELVLEPISAGGLRSQAFLFRKDGTTVFSIYKTQSRFSVGVDYSNSLTPSALEKICEDILKISESKKQYKVIFDFKNRCDVFYHPKRLIPESIE